MRAEHHVRWLRNARVALVAALAAAVVAGTAGAETEEDRLAELERRVEELEAERAAGAGGAAEWTRHLSLGVFARTGYYYGERNSFYHKPAFEIWDARFFVDVELGDALDIGELRAVRNVGVSFEWNLVRMGDLANDVGDLYFELQGLGGSSFFDLAVGRFQLPVGEGYLLYGKGEARDPFISKPVGTPWFWDEGLRLSGSDARGRFGYVASVTNGETPFNDDAVGVSQGTLKLFVAPTDWLHLSASGLYTGTLGSGSSAASGALWLGEAWGRSVGDGSSLDTWIDGAIAPPAPNEIEDSWYAGADVVVDLTQVLRLWLQGGVYDLPSAGPSAYDRTLYTWTAELVGYGEALHAALRNTYLGLRVSGLGTYDDERGYLLDRRDDELTGYNAEYLHAASLVLGWRPWRPVVLRFEYTWRDAALVKGARQALSGADEHLDYFGFEVGGFF